MSLPSRERGLKFEKDLKRFEKKVVAPFAGAWIEIYTPSFAPIIKPSLPSRERGLKSKATKAVKTEKCRSLRGSVD